MNASRFKNRITRREFLKGSRPKRGGRVFIHEEKCTGCGLCAMNCPTGALTLLKNRTEDTYRLFFRHDLCNTCAHCEKSCPEECLRLERGRDPRETGEAAKVIFEDKVSRCSGCGFPLFPQAMIHRLKLKVTGIGDSPWPFDLCPPCRIKAQFEKERMGKSKD